MSGIPPKIKRVIHETVELHITRAMFMNWLREELKHNPYQVKSIPKNCTFDMEYKGKPFMQEFNEPITVRWTEKRNMDTGETES
jgi:hypothetical protein